MLNSDFAALAGVTRRRAWGLTFLLMLAVSVARIDRQVMPALAPTITAALGISDGAYGWLPSSFASATLLGSLPAAWLIHKIGPRLGLILSLAVAAFALSLHSLAGGFWLMLALNIGLGLALAASFPAATQAIHRVLPFKDLNIWADGRAVLCCNDWNEQHPVGDLNTQSLAEIWQGAALAEARRLHREGKGAELPICASCNYWQEPTRGLALWS